MASEIDAVIAAPVIVEERAADLGRKVGLLILFAGALLCERAAHFGLRAFLVLFLAHQGYEREEIYGLYSDFPLALYLSPLLGGLLALRGNRPALLVVGLASKVLGYGLIASGSTVVLYPALTLLVVGQGLFWIALFALTSNLFLNVSEALRSAAFVLLYLMPQLGGLLGPSLGAVAERSGPMAGGAAFAGAALLALGAVAWALRGETFRSEAMLPGPRRGLKGALLLIVLCIPALWSAQLLESRTQKLYSSGGEITMSLMVFTPLVSVLTCILVFGLLLWAHSSRRTVGLFHLVGGGCILLLMANLLLVLSDSASALVYFTIESLAEAATVLVFASLAARLLVSTGSKTSPLLYAFWLVLAWFAPDLLGLFTMPIAALGLVFVSGVLALGLGSQPATVRA